MNSQQQLLRSPSTVATVLAAIVLEHYGDDGLYFEPEILRGALNSLAGSVVPEVNLDKLHGLTTAITTDSFYYEPSIFNQICNALGGFDESVNFETFDIPDPEEVAWAVTEVYLNDPPEKGSEAEFAKRFAPGIITYMGEILVNSGIGRAPSALSFVPLPEPDLESDPFKDDATLLTAYAGLQLSNTQSVDDYVASRMYQMWKQMQEAKLPSISAEKLNRFMESSNGSSERRKD